MFKFTEMKQRTHFRQQEKQQNNAEIHALIWSIEMEKKHLNVSRNASFGFFL